MHFHLAAVVVLTLAVSGYGLVNGTVYLRDGAYTFESGKSDPSAVAYGSFCKMIESATGFGQLTIQANKLGAYNDRLVWCVSTLCGKL